jgi:hypothetical protein
MLMFTSILYYGYCYKVGPINLPLFEQTNLGPSATDRSSGNTGVGVSFRAIGDVLKTKFRVDEISHENILYLQKQPLGTFSIRSRGVGCHRCVDWHDAGCAISCSVTSYEENVQIAAQTIEFSVSGILASTTCVGQKRSILPAAMKQN